MRLTEEVKIDATGLATVTISAVPGRPSAYQSSVRVFLEWFLGASLEDYVRLKREQNPPRTWRGIAEDMAKDVEQVAARLHPEGPGLRIAISHTLPLRISGEMDETLEAEMADDVQPGDQD